MPYEQPFKATDQDVAAIKAVIAEWESAANAGDAARVTATYARDAVLMPPHASAVIGTDAIRPFFQRGFFEPFNVKISIVSDEIQVLGNTAFRRGRYDLTLTPKSGGEPIADNGKYIEIWQRQSDGSWKMARDIWNSDRPLPGM